MKDPPALAYLGHFAILCKCSSLDEVEQSCATEILDGTAISSGDAGAVVDSCDMARQDRCQKLLDDATRTDAVAQ